MKQLIYNQESIPKHKWRYGLRSSAATGCGWIAAYNALCLMGYRPKEEKLIVWYARSLPVINGNVGTFLLSHLAFFKRLGFPVRMTAKVSRFDQTAKDSDVCILFYYWRKKWKIGAHYVTLHYKDSRFYGYNTYKNSTGADDYGESLQKFLKRRKYLPAVLISVKDRKRSGVHE
ncbi:MAG: hypothetical protein J6J43_04935 [Oscillospiraceae bacterium]|nr:hypothetical protein [Oscillospiraceae bacterium]